MEHVCFTNTFRQDVKHDNNEEKTGNRLLSVTELIMDTFGTRTLGVRIGFTRVH